MSVQTTFALVACAALVGVAVLGAVIAFKFWPSDEELQMPKHEARATYRIPKCGHTIRSSDPWQLVLDHAAHQQRCTIERKRVL
jgi:hypothetical protein